jgi:hypothetical protein
VTTRGATLAALLAVLGRPSWWLLGLAGFLARGGILLFLLAIVTLPSPLALSNVLSPMLVPIVFGGVTPTLVVILVAAAGSLVAWILLGAWIGAATQVVLIVDARRAAPEEGVPVGDPREPGRWLITRVAVAHLLAQLPLAIAILLGSLRIVDVTYRELTAPADISIALPLRVVTGAIGPIVAIVVAWLIGEIAGGWAARRIVLGGGSVVESVTGGYGDLLSRPRSSLLPSLLTTGVLALDLAAMLAAVDLAWTAARERLGIGLALASFAAIWTLALLVAGLIDAWRSVAMTFEAERLAALADASERHPDGSDGRSVGGTFGASGNRRPGDWSAGDGGGSL